MNRGAFVVYKEPIERLEQRNPVMVSNERNMNKRMIAFLRALPSTTDNKPKSLEKDRCFGHMVCERLRREKEKQNYAALHPLLPAGTKIDKISIVQMATLQLQDLQNVKEELRKQNYELEKKLCVKEEEKINVAKITLQVKGPSSSMDSMIGVLRCLKSMGLKASTISSLFSTDELSAAMDIETKIEAGLVKKAVESALAEVENKFQSKFL
ncbi:hypothetical protein GIB67_027152 [Kingdonia uniflora]|uniref:BHLH domain-containing protein n=1 Tax=Kingdonia uniflora TaxID=39325 RepID=A0A7J7P1X1_9MAGN|nr:hypothetical protein GIB67_027152 [Kingdonia uniflora]